MARSKPSGFTLLEILMAVALVAIVSAVALPRFIDFRSDAKAAVTSDHLASLRSAIVGAPGRPGYQSHMGSAPAALSDLTTQGTKPAYNPINKTGWNGPYIDGTVTGWDKDGWGTTYQYNGATRTIKSCGANATCGDADDVTLNF
jgi:prepilin-type N-terminal cleavage/methylation domain-containing protein